MKATAKRRLTSLCDSFGVFRFLYFFDACGLSTQFTNVVKLRTPHPAMAHKFDLVDDSRVKGEDALHSVTERDFANRKRCSRAAMLLRDADSLENLNAFLIAFLDLNVHLDGV